MQCLCEPVLKGYKMKSFLKFIGICWLFFVMFLAGCSDPQGPQGPISPDPSITIGSVSEIYFFEAIPLRGLGIVADLHGKGSSECPPRIRRELEKYIWKQIPGEGISPGVFIDSKDTAVVEVFGLIPSLVSGKETFDVAVRPLTGTQTISLDGGHLYTTELKELSRLVNISQFTAFSKTFATVEGPIFSNTLSGDKNEEGIWYVLGGAKVLEAEKITLALNDPDFLMANAIRNRINERFGNKIAIALSDEQIQLQVPYRYQKDKQRFLKMVRSLQLSDNARIQQEHIDNLIGQLLTQADKDTPEIGLEAIGRQASNSLAPHLKHADESVRFHAARCMLNTEDERAVPVLRKILMTPESPYRLAAVTAIGNSANRDDARSALLLAVDDADVAIRLAAYEALLRSNSPIVSRTLVAGTIAVDSIVSSGPKMIYVFQQETPRIVLFGSPIYCNKNIFVQSDNGGIIVNARPGDAFVAVSRKHPERPRVIGPLKTGYEVRHLLQTLGGLSKPDKHSGVRAGLAVPYDEIIPFLKKMCDVKAIDAEFIAGPPTEIDPMLKNLLPIQG